MKEPYGEGLASHTDPESWGCARKDVLQALTGARAGRVLSREITSLGCRRRDKARKATPSLPQTRGSVRALRGRRPRARSEPPCARTGRSRGRPSSEMGRVGKSKDVIRR